MFTKLKMAAVFIAAAVLILTSGCATVPAASDKPSAEVKRCEGTSSQRARQVIAQRYEAEKCKL